MPEYKPGVCNIGENEIRKRYALAVIAFVVSALLVYAVVLLNLARWALLLSFIPLVMGFEGLYQGYFKFCAGFAAAGKYDFTGSGGSKSNVTDSESHKKDLQKARRIHIYSIISSIIIVVIIYFVI